VSAAVGSGCPATLNLRGEHYQCDKAGPHRGWAHCNAAANAVWTSESTVERDCRRIAEALERIALQVAG
jgi:hypothetical protein